MKRKIGVLLINQNDRSRVIDCIKSLSVLKKIPLEIYILDNNCSKNERTRKISNEFPQVVGSIYSSEWLTEAAGYNQLVDLAYMAGCELAWIINSSCRVVVDNLNRELKLLNRKQVAAIGSDILRGKSKIITGGGKLTWRSMIAEEGAKKDNNPSRFECERVDWLNLSNLIIKTGEFKRLKGFDPSYYRGMIEVDLGQGMKRKRKKWLRVNRPLVKLAGKITPTTPLQEYFRGRNQFLLLKKHFSGNSLQNKLIKIVPKSIEYSVNNLRRKKKSRELLESYWEGVRDGINLLN